MCLYMVTYGYNQTLWWQSQEDPEFSANLGYVVSFESATAKQWDWCFYF